MGIENDGGAPGGAGDAGGGDGNDGTPAPSIEDTLRDLLESRGDALGDGNPPGDEPDPAPKPGDAPAPPAPKPGDAPAPPAPPAPDRRPVDLTKAPTSWKPELGAKWATLEEDVRAEIHRREEDSARGVAELKPQVEAGRRFQEAIKPFEAELRQFNVDPIALTGNLLAAHRTLALGTPEAKAAMFAKLAKDYQIALPGPAKAGDPAFGEPGWIDPQVKALQDELALVKSGLQNTAQAQAEARRAELAREVTAFASDPAHPHFDKVTQQVAEYFASKNGQTTLKEAYEHAIWAHPEVRELLIAERADKERTEKEAAEKKAAETARLNNLKLRPRSRDAGTTTPAGSIDDTLKETLKAINARG